MNVVSSDDDSLILWKALVIFAHYCTLLGQWQRSKQWLTVNRGKGDTQLIMDIIGEEWVPWMQMPLAQLDIEPQDAPLQVAHLVAVRFITFPSATY